MRWKTADYSGWGRALWAKGDIARSYGLKIIDSFAGKQAVTMMDSRGKQIGHEFTERVTFIVVPGGKISSTIGGMSPADNVKAALAAVQELKGHAAH